MGLICILRNRTRLICNLNDRTDVCPESDSDTELYFGLSPAHSCLCAQHYSCVLYGGVSAHGVTVSRCCGQEVDLSCRPIKRRLSWGGMLMRRWAHGLKSSGGKRTWTDGSEHLCGVRLHKGSDWTDPNVVRSGTTSGCCWTPGSKLKIYLSAWLR